VWTALRVRERAIELAHGIDEDPVRQGAAGLDHRPLPQSRTELALLVERGALLDLPTQERRPGPR
jgi:hypothetical protein